MAQLAQLATPSELLVVLATTQQSLDMVDMGDMEDMVASRLSLAASLAVAVASRPSLAASQAVAVASRRSLAGSLVVDALQEVVPQERALATPAWVCTPDLPTPHPCLPTGGVATTVVGEWEGVASTLALTLGTTPFPLASPAVTTPFLLASPALDQLLCTGQEGAGVPLEGVDHLGLLEGAGHLDPHMGGWLEA